MTDENDNRLGESKVSVMSLSQEETARVIVALFWQEKPLIVFEIHFASIVGSQRNPETFKLLAHCSLTGGTLLSGMQWLSG